MRVPVVRGAVRSRRQEGEKRQSQVAEGMDAVRNSSAGPSKQKQEEQNPQHTHTHSRRPAAKASQPVQYRTRVLHSILR